MATSEEDLVSMVKALIAAYDVHDLDAILAFHSEDVIVRTGPSPFTDVARSKQQMQSWCWASAEPPRGRVLELPGIRERGELDE
jgi:hypothetical protein